MTAQEMRDYAKSAAEAMESKIPLSQNVFFDATLAQHDDAMVQQLSAELVSKGIPEQPFFATVESIDEVITALQETDDIDDPSRLVDIWMEVNPHFLSRAEARKEDVVFSRLMSKWESVKKNSQQDGKKPPMQ
jgi:hypothetical protein